MNQIDGLNKDKLSESMQPKGAPFSPKYKRGQPNQRKPNT